MKSRAKSSTYNKNISTYLFHTRIGSVEAGEQFGGVPLLLGARAERVVAVAAPHVHLAGLGTFVLVHVLPVQHRVFQGLVVVFVHYVCVYT